MSSPTEKLEVVVIGGAAMDWVAQVDQLPGRDELVVADTLSRFPGGSAANVAVGLARLGRRVGFVGKLGDDQAGRTLLQAFHEAKVDSGHTLMEAGRQTAFCFIGLDRGGDRVIFALPGASLIEDPAELDPNYWQGAAALYIGPSYPAVALMAARTGKAAGSILFFAPGGGWGPDGLAELQDTLRLIDVLILSQSEALQLTELPTLTAALQHLAACGPALIVTTRGVEGALLLQDGETVEVPAVPAPSVRDTTGAGDAFAAGLVAGFLEGHSWPAATRYGAMAAALKVGQFGARNGLPTLQEITQAMNDMHFDRGTR